MNAPHLSGTTVRYGNMSTNAQEDRELTRDEIVFAYTLILGRTPSEHELERMMERGAGLSRVRRVFLASPEFARQIERFLPHHEVRIARRLEPAQAKRYLHLHIPKTAGTTISAILATAIGHDRSVTVSENGEGPLGGRKPQELMDYTFIFGHLSYRAMQFFPPDTQAICALRRPGDRLFSFFRYVGRTKDHPLYRTVTKKKMSFGKFLEFIDADPRHQRGSDNVQMRIISGLTGEDHLGEEEKIFEIALSNLTSGRVLFGLTERFDAFQAYLKHKGLIRKISAARLNASDSPAPIEGPVEALTPTQREIYDRYIVWDTLLYNICDKIALDREMALPGPDDPAS